MPICFTPPSLLLVVANHRAELQTVLSAMHRFVLARGYDDVGHLSSTEVGRHPHIPFRLLEATVRGEIPERPRMARHFLLHDEAVVGRAGLTENLREFPAVGEDGTLHAARDAFL